MTATNTAATVREVLATITTAPRVAATVRETLLTTAASATKAYGALTVREVLFAGAAHHVASTVREVLRTASSTQTLAGITVREVLTTGYPLRVSETVREVLLTTIVTTRWASLVREILIASAGAQTRSIVLFFGW